MRYLLAFIAGVAGSALGWVVAAAATLLIAGQLGVSDFEGERAMTAIFGVGPIGGVLGLIAGVALALRWRGGLSAGAIAWRLPLVIAAIAAATTGVMWWLYETRPVLNSNGPAPVLAFEVRLPAGLAAPEPGAIGVDLFTDRNSMPGRIDASPSRTEEGRAVLTGEVELAYRASWRILRVEVPGQADRAFRLALPASPRHTTAFGSWERAQFISGPSGDGEPRRAGPDEGFEARYRIVWPE